MTQVDLPLARQQVLLSASVPSPDREALYMQQMDAPYRIRDAVVAVAHAILKNGGRLVFGGHPTISPLVLLVAGELFAPDSTRELVRRPITVYQSRAFERTAAAQTRLMEQLGYARIVWTPLAKEEDEASAAHPNSTSLRVMRETMIFQERLSGGVFIGGMEGLLDEYALFRGLPSRWPGREATSFLLPTTGGAAAVLAREWNGRDRELGYVDEVVCDGITASVNGFDAPGGAFLGGYVSYPLVAEEIVRRLTNARQG